MPHKYNSTKAQKGKGKTKQLKQKPFQKPQATKQNFQCQEWAISL